MTQQQELDAQTLHESKAQKISEINADYNTAKYADIDFNNATFDFPNGQTNQTDLASLIAGGATNIAWVDNNGAIAITTMTALKAFSRALNDRASLLFAEKNTKIAQVKLASGKSEVRAI